MTVGQSPTCSFSVSDGREVLFLSPFRAVLGAIHVQVIDRPSPDAPSLTQTNNCANGLFQMFIFQDFKLSIIMTTQDTTRASFSLNNFKQLEIRHVHIRLVKVNF